jgi:hypothetical protein
VRERSAERAEAVGRNDIEPRHHVDEQQLGLVLGRELDAESDCSIAAGEPSVATRILFIVAPLGSIPRAPIIGAAAWTGIGGGADRRCVVRRSSAARQERADGACDHEVLASRHHLDAERTEVAQPGGDRFPDVGAVLADAAAECEHVETPEHCGHRGDRLGEVIREVGERERIVETAERAQSRFLVEDTVELVDRRSRAEQVEQRARIDRARARCPIGGPSSGV